MSVAPTAARTLTTISVAVTVTLALGASAALADPGDLDPTFGAGGTVTTDLAGDWDEGHAVAVQADGMIVVAGETAAGHTDVLLARYEPDGDLDPTFGAGGTVVTDFAGGDDTAFAVALQDDGKVVIAGRATADTEDVALARYEPGGDLDPTFGEGGKVVTDLDAEDDAASAVVIQADGGIVIAGWTGSGSDADFLLGRYDPDGNLDPTFGPGGTVVTDFAGGQDRAFDLVLQEDGSLVAAGTSFSSSGDRFDFALARYEPDGDLDPTFGTGGIVATDFGLDGADESASAVALQEGGKLVAAGWTASTVEEEPGEEFQVVDFALARYEPDGDLDPTFGTGGTVITDLSDDDELLALAIQEDGGLVAAGTTITGDYDFAVARYEDDGDLDPSFGTGGIVTTDFDAEVDIGNALVIQEDGKLVVAGRTGPIDSADVAVARYHAFPDPLGSQLSLTIPPRKDWKGPVGTMTATLVEAETGDPIAGRTVRFLADGELLAESVTDAAGVAMAPTTPHFNATTEVRAEFDGDQGYEPAAVEVQYQPGSGAAAASE